MGKGKVSPESSCDSIFLRKKFVACMVQTYIYKIFIPTIVNEVTIFIIGVHASKNEYHIKTTSNMNQTRYSFTTCKVYSIIYQC